MGAKIAVLLAAYNGRALIGHQISSILAQESVDVSLFVSVDRSDDGTEQFIDQLSLGEDRIRILPHGKGFGGAGPNFYRLIQEVDFSGFDYVAFSDQDDIWFPNKLLRACEALTRSGADGYSSNVTAFWPDGRQVFVNKSQPQVRWDFLFEAAGPGCTYVISAKLAFELQAFIIEHHQKMQKIALHDWFTYAFARSRGYRWIIDETSGMHYRQHAKNQVGVNSGFSAFKSRLKNILGGWAISQAALIADTLGLAKKAPVRDWFTGTRLGYLRLMFNAFSCRRRFRDQLLFLVMCMLMVILGPIKS